MVTVNNNSIAEQNISQGIDTSQDPLLIQPLDDDRGVGELANNLNNQEQADDLEEDVVEESPDQPPIEEAPADTEAPVSTVDVLPNNVPEDFTVSWYGFDTEGGTGIASYDIFVSTNGGEYVLWQNDTTAISGVYDGQSDRQYEFYSVATDNAGNEESTSEAQVSTSTGNTSQQPAIYRLFNSSTGVHLYTSSVVERDSVIQSLPNYNYEGVAYFAANPENGVPVYRLYSPTVDGHFYTVSEAERDEIIASTDYALEGENGQAFTAFAEQVEGTIPVYRFFIPDTGAYFYTSDENERETIIRDLPNYSFEGVAYYSFPLDADFRPLEREPTDNDLNFIGSEVFLQIYSPDFDTPSTNGLSAVVGDGVEFGDLPADNLGDDPPPVDVNIDITATSVLFEVEQPTGGTFGEGEFNGYVFFDLTDTVPLIQNVTIDPAGTTLAVDDSDLVFIDDAFALDVSGVDYSQGDTVKLDFSFGTGSSTPDTDTDTDPDSTPNSAGFNGAELTYQEYSPDLETPFGDPINFTVGEGPELNINDGELEANGIGATIDLTNDTIRYEVVTNSPGGTYAAADFNGFVFFDLSDTLPTITNVTIDETATTLGIDESDIVFIDDAIAINAENVAFANGDVIQLDVDFAENSTGEDSDTDAPSDGSGANFTGTEISYQSFFPDADTLSGETLTATVGSGIEFEIPASDGVLGESIDISGNSIIYQVTSADSSFTEAEFNGVLLFDADDNIPAITNVTIDSSATTLGIEAEDISFAEEGITINLESVAFAVGDSVKLDVEFADI